VRFSNVFSGRNNKFLGYHCKFVNKLRYKKPWDLIKTIIDIGIVSFVIYKLIKLIRETRAWQLIKGILVIVIAARASELIGFKTLSLY